MKKCLLILVLFSTLLSFSQDDQYLGFINTFTVSNEKYQIVIVIDPVVNGVRAGKIRYNPQGDPAVPCSGHSFSCMIVDSLVYMGQDSASIDKTYDAYLSKDELHFIRTDVFGCKPDAETVIFQKIEVVMDDAEKTETPLDEPGQIIPPVDDQMIEIESPPDALDAEPITDKNQVIYDFAEVNPSFPGGEAAMINFINQNIQYPKDGNDFQGTVYVQFVVWDDGSLSDVTILKGVTPPLDREALRIVKIMPKWIPGSRGGKNVTVRHRIPIRFSIQ